MTKVLLVIGGILNSLFFLLHLVLSYQIHNLTQLAAGYRGLLQALNVGGVLFIFFFAFVSFFCRRPRNANLNSSAICKRHRAFLSQVGKRSSPREGLRSIEFCRCWLSKEGSCSP